MKEVNFTICTRGKGGTTDKLSIIHDEGQGGSDVVVSLGDSAIVVNAFELANMARRAHELLGYESWETQIRTSTSANPWQAGAAGLGVGPAVQHCMPSIPRNIEGPGKVTYDRFDK